MKNIKKSLGVSLLFSLEKEDGSVSGIIRSFIIPQCQNLDAFFERIGSIYSNYAQNENYVGVEDVFHVTQFEEDDANSIYGKSYIEPTNKNAVNKLISKRKIAQQLKLFGSSETILVSLIYYSKLEKLGISCLTNCSIEMAREYLSSVNEITGIFDSTEFKLGFINQDFDNVSPKNFMLLGIEDIYTFINETIDDDSLFFMCLTKSNVSSEELNELTLDNDAIEEALRECEEWLECLGNGC